MYKEKTSKTKQRSKPYGNRVENLQAPGQRDTSMLNVIWIVLRTLLIHFHLLHSQTSTFLHFLNNCICQNNIMCTIIALLSTNSTFVILFVLNSKWNVSLCALNMFRMVHSVDKRWTKLYTLTSLDAFGYTTYWFPYLILT